MEYWISSISDDLLIIADSFNLALSSPTNPCSTRYSDIVEEANSTIDLIFLYYGSSEINQHSIYLEWQLTSDHAPLFIIIPIMNEIINTSKLSILIKSKQEVVFIKEIILSFKNLDTSNIINKEYLEDVVNNLDLLVNQAWNKNTK